MSSKNVVKNLTVRRQVFVPAICYLGEFCAFSGFVAVLVAYIASLGRHIYWSNGSLAMVTVSAGSMLLACVGLGFIFGMALLRFYDRVSIRMKALYAVDPHLDSLILIYTEGYALSAISIFTISHYFTFASDLLAYLMAAFFAFAPVVFAVVLKTLPNVVKKEQEETSPSALLLRNYFIIGFAIFAVMTMLTLTASLRDFQVSIYSRDVQWHRVVPDTYTNAVSLGLKSSEPTYLSVCYNIVLDLKKVGVTSILVPLPNEFRLGDREYQDLRRLQNTGIVVFGKAPIQASQFFPKWRVNHPTLYQLEVSWGVFSCEENIPKGMQFVPFGYKTSTSDVKVADVALELIRKYENRPDSGQIKRIGNHVVVGSYSIPVLREGVIYLGYGFFPNEMIEASYDAGRGRTSYYRPDKYSKGKEISDSVFANQFGKRIVFICPTDINVYFNSQILTVAVLTGKLPFPLDDWNEVFVLFSLLCAGAICYKLPPLHSFIVLSIGVILVYFAGLLILKYTSALVEPIYVMVATCIGIASFPVAKIAHKKKNLQEAHRNRLSEEIKAAHDMQMGLMPTADPDIPGFDISGLCRPADEVGGDYFDYVWLNDSKTKIGIAVADVSGKAMKAAITAVMTSGMVYREAGTNETPKSILKKINKPIYLKTDKRIFTAMSFAVIDIKRKKMTFSNAGQMQPLLRRGRKIQTLKVGGAHLPLGMAENVEYSEIALQLRKGDVVVFYTDGVPEAMNEKKELFGFERLEAIVKESLADLSAKQLADKIVDKVAEYTGSTKQHDDMTVVAVKVL